MNEGAAIRVLSFLNDSSQLHVTSLVNEKHRVTVIGEENEPDEVGEEQRQPAVVFDSEETYLAPERIKEFFKAAQEGSIEKLEELFDIAGDIDIDMTQYTESLLMEAIRAKKSKAAEYLIDQIGVNVNYNTNFLEFRPNTTVPVREQTASCRDLAYSRGLMDLVDLIDITSDDVKPHVKRYLQRRLKTRLEQIHQVYLRRMKDRNNRLVIQLQSAANATLEEDEKKTTAQPSTGNVVDEKSSIPMAYSTVPIPHRQYTSHIQAAVQNIQSKNEKCIDETGKKSFRFSDYTLRYQLTEEEKPKKSKRVKFRPQTAPFSLATVPATSTCSQPSRETSSPTRSATAHNNQQRSLSTISQKIPIRETRTSICRSARRTVTPRIISAAPIEHKLDTTLKTTPMLLNLTTTTPKAAVRPIIVSTNTTLSTNSTVVSTNTTMNTTPRLLPKRVLQMKTNYRYLPQLEHAIYNNPRHFMPVTLKATATGLPHGARLLRD